MEDSENSEIVIYQGDFGEIEFIGEPAQESLFASQKQIADLFQVDTRTVNKHLKNIYDSNELDEQSTIRKFRIVQKEGTRDVNREVLQYNLDAILSVGYRVNSSAATKFRKWANSVLRSYLLDGYSVNTNRLSANYNRREFSTSSIVIASIHSNVGLRQRLLGDFKKRNSSCGLQPST